MAVPEDAGFDAGSDEADAGFDAGPGELDAGSYQPYWDGGQTQYPDGGSGPFLLRVVAANTTSGNLQSYTPGHGVRIFQGLKPDVALVQEMNYGGNTPADIRAFVDAAFGPEFWFYREPTGQIPNGVVSRYRIAEVGFWDDPETNTREFAWARIDLPGSRDLWAVSVHLLTGGNRTAEAQALLARLQALPADDYVVLGGDFNSPSRGDGSASTLSTYFKTSAPYPVDQAGNDKTNANRSSPYDWVLADSQLQAASTPVVIGGNRFDAGLVFDSRVYTPLGDVAPVLAGDSDAPSMQHMAVVRDFLLP